MEEKQIYKRLKQIYNEYSEKYEILLLSKIDDMKYILIVIPTVDDILSYTNYIDVLDMNNIENGIVLYIYDIRCYYNTTKNSDMYNVLGTKYKILNKKYKDLLNKGLTVKTSKETVSGILKRYIEDVLKINPPIEYKLCPDQYSRVFVTSDNHFGHQNILRYEDRVSKMQITTLEEHDNILKNNWNNVVGKNDLVIIMGDFSFKKAIPTMELLNELNGDKVLIRGNHDIYLDDKKFDNSVFKGVFDYIEAKYRGQEMCLMHYPIQSFKHQNRIENNSVLLFGHIHSENCIIPKKSYNVGVDVNNYTPIPLEIAIGKANSNLGGIYNGKL